MSASPALVTIAVCLSLAAGAALLYAHRRSVRRSGARTPGRPLTADVALHLARSLVSAVGKQQALTDLTNCLPHILDVDRLWITCNSSSKPGVIVGRRQLDEPLLADGQSWTTFRLRAGEEDVGWLGVSSDRPLSDMHRQRIELMAPIIAHYVDAARVIADLRQRSVIDSLTGMTTRAAGLDRLRAEINRAQRTGKSLAVLMVDLDHFKSINDRFGHLAGDAALRTSAAAMSRRLRASDVQCRWGGEEFIFVLPETSRAQAEAVAEGLLQEVRAASLQTPYGPVTMTASIGVTLVTPGESDAESVIRRADAALYAAKAAGRATFRTLIAGAAGPEQRAHAAVERHGPSVDRRSASRSDRRAFPGPGRRRTDTASVAHVENVLDTPADAAR